MNNVEYLQFLRGGPWMSERMTSRVWEDNRRALRRYLKADVSKYRPEVYKSEKSKILKKNHKVALGISY